ncbi:MAG: hypothetical protein LAO77_01750 [Acidobacteriia bacterium]|nr:hypothetical protein [Terriglobia bacterium]
MRRALLVLVVALAVVPVANDACCDLDQPVAPPQTASADPSCPLHAHNGSDATTPRPQPKSPIRCTHDLSIDRAGLVKTIVAPAPDLTLAIVAAPATDLVSIFDTLSPATPRHAPPRRTSRSDVLRI